MKTITILNKEVAIVFNMAVQIAYEQITDKAFDLTDMVKAESRMALYYACIIANNPDTDIDMNQMLRECSLDDIKTIDKAVNEVISEWYHIPAQAEANVQEQEAEEDGQKNA